MTRRTFACLFSMMGLVAPTPARAEAPKPLSVKAFIVQERLAERASLSSPAMSHGSKTIPSLMMGSARPVEQFEVEAYVQDAYLCPPCPPDARCEPCNSYLVVSDSAESCLQPGETSALDCPDILVVYLDYPGNYPHV